MAIRAVILAGAAAVAMLAPGSVLADDDDFSRPGLYVGASGSIGAYTRYDDEIERGLRALGLPVDRVEIETAVGVKVRLGYRAHPRFAAEAEYEFLPDVTLFLNCTESRCAVGRQSTWMVGANGKAFALTGRFQPYGLVGLGVAGSTFNSDVLGAAGSVSRTGFAARFGAGLDVYATEHIVFALDLSYVLPTGDLDGLDYMSFGWGAQYRF